jgi:metal-sulfur cluster biosynthetic enzyme
MSAPTETAIVTGTDLDTRIVEALRTVHDPCSIAQQVPISIYDMGLVRDWEFDAGSGALRVRMCVTSFMCMMSPHFTSAAKAELEKIEEIESAECYVDPTILWTDDLMTAEGAEGMKEKRQRSSKLLSIRPRQWKETLQPDNS